jgi:hypothetical protein
MVRWPTGEIVSHDMDDLMGVTIVTLAVVGKVERLWLAGVGSGSLHNHKVIDERIKLREPDLQNVQLVEKREAIENARRVHLTALATC